MKNCIKGCDIGKVENHFKMGRKSKVGVKSRELGKHVCRGDRRNEMGLNKSEKQQT